MSSTARALLAEFIGTAALLAVVIGSGIMGQRLSPDNLAIALLANALSTGFALYVLITVLGPVSRSHFNPIVTFASVINRDFTARLALGYAVMQWCGAVAGVWLAHAMFDLPILQTGGHVRTGYGQWISEAVATALLVLTIAGFSRHAPKQTAAGVGAYIAAAYWFTASTSFANPAVTTARALSDTFAGIRPADVAGFMVAEVAGMAMGLVTVRLVFGRTPIKPRADLSTPPVDVR